MPIKNASVLGYQRRSLRLGEIRIGTSIAIPNKKGRQPQRLKTFRFTVPTQAMADAVAAKYGGHVAPWDQKDGYFEVITEVSAIEVYVPVRGEAADSFMEMWDGPKRLRKCDGETEQMSGEPCMCPRVYDERSRLSKLRPPQACRPLTKIRVTIPGLPGLNGVFQLNTASENALVEIGDTSEALQIAREDGVYLPAVLRIDWRRRVGDASPYPVPVLQIGASFADLAAHALPGGGEAGLFSQLRAGGPQPAAIEAGPATATQDADPPAPVTDEVRQAAQQIADEARAALGRDAVRARIHQARDGGLAAVDVCIDGTWMPLKAVLDDAWELAVAGDAG